MNDPTSIPTIPDLISEMGGPAAFARLIGVTTEHASLMKRRRSIPVAYWQPLLDSQAGKALGLSADDLLNLHADASKNSEASE